MGTGKWMPSIKSRFSLTKNRLHFLDGGCSPTMQGHPENYLVIFSAEDIGKE